MIGHRVLQLLVLGWGSLWMWQTPGVARAEESYYMLIFAQQSEGNVARLAHTFATFVKGDESTLRVDEIRTISWLPATLDIRMVRRPEPGVNLDLEGSLRYAFDRNTQVLMWGPYRIRKELFDRAARQVERLKSGAVAYKALDTNVRPNVATNCIHAVSDIDVDNGPLDTGRARGGEASLLVFRHLQRWILQPAETHVWVSDRLGLAKYPILRQTPQFVNTSP